jgi:hypothetical protein
MPLATTRANASVLGLRGTKPSLQWVLVGDSGTLMTSNDRNGNNFVSVQTSSFGSTNINAVATDGKGKWVAVGQSGKIASSDDGITWTQRTSGFSTSHVNWVAYGGGTWVAVGGSGKVSTSTDGDTWTANTGSNFSSSYAVGHVAYGNGVWVGINSNGTLRTATDPTGAWTSRTSQLGAGQHYAEYHPSFSIWTLGTDGGTSSGSLASSTNGTTWTARSAATSSTADTTFMMASNSSIIIASSNDGSTWVMDKSTNGTSWSAVTEPTSAIGTRSAPTLAVRGEGEDILVGITNTTTIITTSVYMQLYFTQDGSTFTDSLLSGYKTNHAAHRLGHQSIR